jgi:hypothetical protein
MAREQYEISDEREKYRKLRSLQRLDMIHGK